MDSQLTRGDPMVHRPENRGPENDGDPRGEALGALTVPLTASLKDFTLSPSFPVSDADASEPNPDSVLFPDGAESLDPFLRPAQPRSMHWSVAWSDLMMTMFIFFVVMFIYQSAHREFGLGRQSRDAGVRSGNQATINGTLASAIPLADPKEKSLSSFYQVAKKTIEAQHLDTVSSLDLIADRAVRIVLPGDLIFEPGKADLKPSCFASLRKIAEILRATPYMVNVVGHTDSTPIHSDKFPTNWELSAFRASVVVRFLVEEMKLPADRFFVSAHSYLQPVAPNDTWAHRAANRRVEIIVMNQKPASAMENFPIFQKTQ
jgi:chemotaxis protein MotB